jgi:hypothetical protein
VIAITSPVMGSSLYETSKISGNYTSTFAVDNIGIYVDDVFVDSAEIDKGKETFSKIIDWTSIKTGNHTLKVVLTDTLGNTAKSEIPIVIIQAVKASIISPQAKNYLRSNSILVNVKTTPVNASGVIINIDGSPVRNGSRLDLLNLSLGKHTIDVKCGGGTIISREFYVVTSYVDTVNIVLQLYRGGHIKNFGTALAITAKIEAADFFAKMRRNPLKTKTLNCLKRFVEQLSKQKKPLIDQYGTKVLLEQIDYLLL